MKRILLSIFLISSLTISAEKNEMIPLAKWMDDAGDLDDSETLYLAYRCMGLYGMMYGLTDDATNEGSKELNQKIQANQLVVLTIGEVVYNNLTPESKRDYSDNIKTSVQPIADNYQLEANANWINTGMYFNDYIIEDGQVCQLFVDAMLAASQK